MPSAALPVRVCALADIVPGAGVCALAGGEQVAVFRLEDDGVHAVGNFDPFSRANVLSRGIVGDLKGELVVASPVYKQHFSLLTGRCLEDPAVRIPVYAARVEDGFVVVTPRRRVATTCPYCGVGCGVIAVASGNTLDEVRGDPAHPANFGRLCTKGASLHLGREEGARLLHPEVNGARASWDEALEHAAARFAETVARYGPDSVAFYISGQLLTEDYYVFNKLAKGLIGTNNVDTNSRLCMSSAVAGYKLSLGVDAPPCAYEDIDAADLILVAGSNTAFAHPVLFRRVEDARARNPGLKLIVVDPRATVTARAADLHLALKPGTDVALFNAMLHVLQKDGSFDSSFVQGHTENIGALQPILAAAAARRPDTWSEADRFAPPGPSRDESRDRRASSLESSGWKAPLRPAASRRPPPRTQRSAPGCAACAASDPRGWRSPRAGRCRRARRCSPRTPAQ